MIFFIQILSRIHASEASSMSEATHFIADEFTRTRNMLEAIALGKPVVTHLWLESCRQSHSHIHEKNFILRDFKKETELGFNLPSSLTRARKHPLFKVITTYYYTFILFLIKLIYLTFCY